MSMQKLPILGYFIQNSPSLPVGTSGTNALTGAVTNPPANLISIARFKLTVATSAVILSGRCTVTCASHLMTYIGQQVTFSGATGPGTGLNNQTWTIDTITSSSVYSFPCNLADGTATGTVVQEPVFTLPQGFAFVQTGANALVEICTDNSYNSNLGYTSGGVAATFPTGSGTGWESLVAASSSGLTISDGFGTRVRCSGTTATTYVSLIG